MGTGFGVVAVSAGKTGRVSGGSVPVSPTGQ